MINDKQIIPAESIQQVIYFIRGQKVVLDKDLAGLYGVTTKRLNEQVKRNRERFPVDFMFQLTPEEAEALRSQIAISNIDANWSQFATSSQKHRNPRYLPYVFTEHGALMAASVLNTTRAVEMSLFVVRAFVKLREMVTTHRALAQKLAELERRLQNHGKTIRSLVVAIRELMTPPTLPRKSIGFLVKERGIVYKTGKSVRKSKK
jgi:hypothetical protein